MGSEDRLALIPFENNLRSDYYKFTLMIEANKTNAINYIDKLYTSGGTNIYEGLKGGLDLLIDNYQSGKTIASMILFSDGQDLYSNAEGNFKQYIKSQKKDDFLSTLHSFDYGDDHEAVLMNNISKIKNGGYFFILHLSNFLLSKMLSLKYMVLYPQ